MFARFQKKFDLKISEIADSEENRRMLFYAAISGDNPSLIHDAYHQLDIKKIEFNPDHSIPLIEAVLANADKAINELCTLGFDPNEVSISTGATPLYTAICEEKAIATLLAIGADPNIEISADCSTPFTYSCQTGSVELVKLLFENGGDINHRRSSDGLSPLSVAANFGHIEVIGFLLSKEVDVRNTVNNEIPIVLAAMHGHTEIVRLLLRAGTDVDCRRTDGKTALHWAAQGGHLETVKYLHQKGGDINCIDNNGNTPLICAVDNAQNAVSEYLCTHSNNVMHINKAGFSAKGVARLRQHEDILEILKEKDQSRFSIRENLLYLKMLASVYYLKLFKTSDWKYRIAYNFVTLCRNDSLAGVKAHINALGSDTVSRPEILNFQNEFKETPLFAASSVGNADMVKLLLDLGADHTIRSAANMTPKGIALQRNNDEVVEIITEFEEKTKIDNDASLTQ